jgi:hypothetical protein
MSGISVAFDRVSTHKLLAKRETIIRCCGCWGHVACEAIAGHSFPGDCLRTSALDNVFESIRVAVQRCGEELGCLRGGHECLQVVCPVLEQ